MDYEARRVKPQVMLSWIYETTLGMSILWSTVRVDRKKIGFSGFIQIEFLFAEAHWVKFKIKWGKNLDVTGTWRRSTHVGVNRLSPWKFNFISSFSRFTWAQLFPVHFFSSPYNSSKNSYKFKVHSAPNLWQHFKQDSPNQALTTVFFNSSFYVFFFPFYIRSCKWYGNLK